MSQPPMPWRPSASPSASATPRRSRGVDLVVEPGTVLGLLGPNGAGKTTTVRILTTLLRPDAGRAIIDGIDVVADPRRVRARIGLTGQYAAVDERLTGVENLEHVGRLFHLPITEARRRGRRAARALRPHRRRRPVGQGLLRRHAPPPRHRHEPHLAARGAVPRRAHHRARPPQPPRHVGPHRGARRRRHHHPAHHPVPRRGRAAGQRHRRHRPRHGDRQRHAPTSSRPSSAATASRSPLAAEADELARTAEPLLERCAVGGAERIDRRRPHRHASR